MVFKFLGLNIVEEKRVELVTQLKGRLFYLAGVSYKWYPSVEGLPNFYSVIDG